MTKTVTALQRLVHDHPTIGLDLNDVLAAMEGENRLARHEVDAVQDASQEAWRSFRAGAGEAAQQAAQRLSNGDIQGSVPGAIGTPLTERGSAQLRTEVGRRHRAVKRHGASYRIALERIGQQDPHGAGAIRRYVSAIRAEAAAARVLTDSLLERGQA